MKWLVVAIVRAVASAAVANQILPGEIERDHLQRDLREYRVLIADYHGGNSDTVGQLLLWDRARIHRTLAAINTTKDESRPWGVERFKAATMMHTDAALRLIERPEMDAALLHIDIGSRLLKSAGPEIRPYAGPWYQAVGWLLRHRNSLPDAERFLDTARARLPHDPTVLYESGTLQELLASDTVLPIVVYLPDLRAPSPGPGTPAVESSVSLTMADVDDLKRRRADRLTRAAEWLRESLAGDPSNMLARLHLGRVQTLRNKNDDALKLLQRAEVSDDAAVAYLAVLFTGAVHEREGRLDAAARAYRAALERFPLNHAAHVALSAVLHGSGRADDSREVLRGVLDSKVASRRDPWWSYLMEPPSVNGARFDLLRREARQ